MDKDRVIGAAKEAAGKLVGDGKLQADGAAQKIEGRMRWAGSGMR